jgi:hypothetical protein
MVQQNTFIFDDDFMSFNPSGFVGSDDWSVEFWATADEKRAYLVSFDVEVWDYAAAVAPLAETCQLAHSITRNRVRGGFEIDTCRRGVVSYRLDNEHVQAMRNEEEFNSGSKLKFLMLDSE